MRTTSNRPKPGPSWFSPNDTVSRLLKRSVPARYDTRQAMVSANMTRTAVRRMPVSSAAVREVAIQAATKAPNARSGRPGQTGHGPIGTSAAVYAWLAM